MPPPPLPIDPFLPEILDAVRSHRAVVVTAAPGAGKTTFALRVATELLSRGEVRAITVVAPTEHLKGQWAEAAARVGIQLDPAFRNAQERHGASFCAHGWPIGQCTCAQGRHAIG